METPLWQPSPERVAGANLTAFSSHVRERWGFAGRGYAELHQWSIVQREQFWQSVWSFCGVVGDTGGGPALLDRESMPGARWFPEARLNFAENLDRKSVV